MEESEAWFFDVSSTGVRFFPLLVKCRLRELKIGQLTGSVCFPKVGLEDREILFFPVFVVRTDSFLSPGSPKNTKKLNCQLCAAR